MGLVVNEAFYLTAENIVSWEDMVSAASQEWHWLAGGH